MNKPSKGKALSWISTLYFAEGLPYVAVMTLSVIMYKRLEVSNAEIALYTSWLYFPWVIKPVWSPFIDLLKTKRWWIWTMQFLIGAGMAGIAFLLPCDFFFRATLAFFWLMAFSSATHDIAADGFYMLGLDEEQQAFFIGIRNIFYRVAMITGQGLLVMLAGWLEETTGQISYAWSLVFFILAGTFIGLALWHRYILPKPASDFKRTDVTLRNIGQSFGQTFVSFFRKKGIIPALLFMLTYRLGESQLVKLSSPFLLDDIESGGLAMSTTQVGFVYGTVGVAALLVGGILGGIAISSGGLKRWLWPMALAISLPNLVYLYLAYARPESFLVINTCVAVEQLGYGFGFTGYTMYLMLFSEGEYKTSHYAICTGFMALGMMVPGMVSGWIQEQIGYQHFFIWVMICCVPLFLVLPFIHRKCK